MATFEEETMNAELVEKIHAAVAQGWCVAPNTSKSMDVELGLAIVNKVIEVVRPEVAALEERIRVLEAQQIEYEKRLNNQLRSSDFGLRNRIEEVKALQARIDRAKRLAEKWKTNPRWAGEIKAADELLAALGGEK